MKRISRFIGMCAALWSVLSIPGCTVEEGDIPPRRTEEAYFVFKSIDDVREIFTDDYYLVAGLREWFAQTTEEGREAVRKRFFGWGHLSRTEEGNWVLSGSDYWDSIAVNVHDSAIGLKSMMVFEKSDELSGITYRFTLRDWDLQLDLAIEYRLWDVCEGTVNWNVAFDVTDEDVIVTAKGSEHCFWKERNWNGDQTARWEVAVHTQEPLRWSVASRGALESRQTLEVWYYVVEPGASPPDALKRHFGFETVQTNPGSVRVLCEDAAEEWNL